MNPHLDTRAARAFAALGAVGVTAAASAPSAHAAHRPKRVEPHAVRAHHYTPTNPFAHEYGVQRVQNGVHWSTRRRHVSRAVRLVRAMIEAGNDIARLPYVWGGGHGSFTASGYDCSGSVSYVLHAAGVLSVPADSSTLMSYGVPGRGKYVTIYANAGHAWMTIDGRRFDTIALQETGARWSRTIPSTAGYVAVHPKGL